MAVDGVPGPVTPTASPSGREDTGSVLFEDENGVVGTVGARNEARIQGGPRAEPVQATESDAPPPTNSGQTTLSTDAVVIAQTSAGETSGQPSGTSVDALASESAETPGARASGSAVDIIV